MVSVDESLRLERYSISITSTGDTSGAFYVLTVIHDWWVGSSHMRERSSLQITSDDLPLLKLSDALSLLRDAPKLNVNHESE